MRYTAALAHYSQLLHDIDADARSRDAARRRRLHYFAICLRDAHERSRQLELDLGERLFERFTSDARDAATREDEWP